MPFRIELMFPTVDRKTSHLNQDLIKVFGVLG
jgi:hypothetical protein